METKRGKQTRSTMALERALRRARMARARRERGAAMVEALIVIPFFIIIFVLSIFLNNLYSEKLRTIRETKKCVWQTAMKGDCQGGCGESTTKNLGDKDLDKGAENNPSQGHPQVDKWLKKTFSETDQTKTGSATSGTVSGIVDGFSVQVGTKQIAMCNEIPEDAQFRSIFLYTYHKLTAW
jgi:hypothetical protein